MNNVWLSYQAAAALAISFAALSLIGCRHTVVSVAEVDQMIKDQVPIGAEKKVVKSFIDNLKIDSLRIGRGDFHQADRRSLGNLDLEKTDRLGDRINEFIGAVIYKARSNGIAAYDDIVISFFFDKDGRMIDYSVRLEGAE
jgi:hypothetical protein